MNATRAVERLRVTIGDRQVVSLAGLHLVGEVADALGLAPALSEAVGVPRAVHDRGRLLTQVALMLAGGGRCVADMDALRDQPEVFGEVASAPTVWRTFTTVDESMLAAMRVARAAAREQAWAARPAPKTLVLDVDASLVEIHSEHKEHAASHFKGGFGFHPLLCFADHSGEALAGILRPGNATANSGADQFAVLDLAIDQLPTDFRAGHQLGDDCRAVAHRIVVRADSAGAVAAFVAGLVDRNCEFSITARTNAQLDAAIAAVKPRAWRAALGSDGRPRPGAQIAELDLAVAGWPAGTRAIVRRERPHPGAQLRLWDRDGYRHQVLLTNSHGDPARLELRHRRHGHVENRIKNLKDTGLERMPFTSFDANTAWMETVLTAADLLAWTTAVLHRRARPLRTAHAALPDSAHRSPHHPQRTTRRTTTPCELAMEPTTAPRLHTPRRAAHLSKRSRQPRDSIALTNDVPNAATGRRTPDQRDPLTIIPAIANRTRSHQPARHITQP